MNFQITIKNYRCFSDSQPVRFLLQKGFNAFVGANNSGKSSLLKFFYEFRSIFELLALDEPTHFESVLKGNYIPFKVAPSVQNIEELFYNGNNRELTIEIQLTEPFEYFVPIEFISLKKLVLKIPRNKNEFTAAFYSDKGKKIEEYTTSSCQPFVAIFKSLKDTLYIGAFRNIMNFEFIDKNKQEKSPVISTNYFDIDLGISFIKKWRKFKHGNNRENREIIYHITQYIKSSFGFQNFAIDDADDDSTLFLTIDGKSYNLSEQGSGLIQFILVLTHVAIKQPSYILIDEPELNLHPSLQIEFLLILRSVAKEGVIFATHSIGLARASNGLIYSVCKSDREGREIHPLAATRRFSELVSELSFNNFNELGFNKILLVEGSTEVKAIQQFLRMYGKDHQIVLLSLGGSDMIKEQSEIELAELKRISDKIYALIDSEKSDSNSELDETRKAFREKCEKQGIHCHVLERRAIENYFTDRAIKEFRGQNYKALQPYEEFKKAKHGWAKADNWCIAQKMSKEELENTDLGNFLADL